MDADSNQVPGLGLSQPSAGQGGSNPVGMPPGMVQPQGVVPVAPSTVAPAQPAAEGDSDDLDQDWVNKAKDMVERTRGDPFAESNELNKIKAGYLKIRFNKDLKVGEDHS